MIIDFHTHAFNEKIVEKALASLTANSGLMPHGAGTIQSLVEIQRSHGAVSYTHLDVYKRQL